jgi:hypothetical protein
MRVTTPRPAASEELSICWTRAALAGAGPCLLPAHRRPLRDRVFYSKKSVGELLERRDHFTLSVPLNNRWVLEAIDEIIDTVQGPEGYRIVDDEPLYVHSRLYPWEKSYDPFFVITAAPKRGEVAYNSEAVSQYSNRYAGFQDAIE